MEDGSSELVNDLDAVQGVVNLSDHPPGECVHKWCVIESAVEHPILDLVDHLPLGSAKYIKEF